jgi:hypothetical protein
MIEQRVHAGRVLRRDRVDVGDAELVKRVHQTFMRGGIGLVHRQRQRPSQALQHARQVAIGAGDFRPPVDQQNDLRRAFQHKLRLAQNLARDVLLVFHHDAAGIDQFEAAPRCSACPCMRSRVIPGSSPTMARRWPVMRLKRVDLPTFGRPTMTTVGMGFGMAHQS